MYSQQNVDSVAALVQQTERNSKEKKEKKKKIEAFNSLYKICGGLIFTLWLCCINKNPICCSRKHTHAEWNQRQHRQPSHYETHSEGLNLFQSHQRATQLWHIKISQPYKRRGTHKCTHGPSSRAVTQGQRRRFIFIMGKGAKSCWYEGGYINANCIGGLLVLEKVCM